MLSARGLLPVTILLLKGPSTVNEMNELEGSLKIVSVAPLATPRTIEMCYFARSPETFCGFLLRICCIEKMVRMFGEFFLVSVSHEIKLENSSNFGGKFGAEFGTNIRSKIQHREGTNLGVFVPILLVLPRREDTNLEKPTLLFLRSDIRFPHCENVSLK